MSRRLEPSACGRRRRTGGEPKQSCNCAASKQSTSFEHWCTESLDTNMARLEATSGTFELYVREVEKERSRQSAKSMLEGRVGRERLQL